MADLVSYHLYHFSPFQLWIPPVYTAGLWRPVASRGQRERTSCTSCPCFCLTTPTSSVEKGNGIAPERTRRGPVCFCYLSPPLLSPTPPQWPRCLRHGSQRVSQPHGGRRQLLHDLPHHLARVPGLHLRLEDGPGTGWEHHSKLEPQRVCLQVSLAAHTPRRTAPPWMELIISCFMGYLWRNILSWIKVQGCGWSCRSCENMRHWVLTFFSLCWKLVTHSWVSCVCVCVVYVAYWTHLWGNMMGLPMLHILL